MVEWMNMLAKKPIVVAGTIIICNGKVLLKKEKSSLISGNGVFLVV